MNRLTEDQVYIKKEKISTYKLYILSLILMEKFTGYKNSKHSSLNTNVDLIPQQPCLQFTIEDSTVKKVGVIMNGQA